MLLSVNIKLDFCNLLEKLFDGDFELLVSDYVEKEFCAKIEEKWPDKFDQVFFVKRTSVYFLRKFQRV